MSDLTIIALYLCDALIWTLRGFWIGLGLWGARKFIEIMSTPAKAQAQGKKPEEIVP